MSSSSSSTELQLDSQTSIVLHFNSNRWLQPTPGICVLIPRTMHRSKLVKTRLRRQAGACTSCRKIYESSCCNDICRVKAEVPQPTKTRRELWSYSSCSDCDVKCARACLLCVYIGKLKSDDLSWSKFTECAVYNDGYPDTFF